MEFAPDMDVDRDGATDFRDIVFCSRTINGHPTVPTGVTLPDGETAADVEARIVMLRTAGDSGCRSPAVLADARRVADLGFLPGPSRSR